jgi:sugar/nucleoside kinase (ribokinase family)
MEAVVLGNTTLDVLCYPVGNVPRRESIVFDRVAVAPGGCGSNVAVGLCSLGIPTGLISAVGTDNASALVEETWKQVDLDTRFVRRVAGLPTAISVGLVDDCGQPRFIHTPGANAVLTPADIDVPALATAGVRAFHIAGYFVLPGLLSDQLPVSLQAIRASGISTSLDVVFSKRMLDPAPLWPCLPHLDVFLCNAREAERLTHRQDPREAACALRSRGASSVVVKLGDRGCWVETEKLSTRLPAPAVKLVDSTGAGDAFAAGLIAAILQGADLKEACAEGNACGARMVGTLGAIGGWFQSDLSHT